MPRDQPDEQPSGLARAGGAARLFERLGYAPGKPRYECAARLVNRLSKRSLAFSSRLCQVDVWSALRGDKDGARERAATCADPNEDEDEDEDDAGRDGRADKRTPSGPTGVQQAGPGPRWARLGRARAAGRKWPAWVFVFDAYFALKLTLNILLQYEHDFCLMRLSSLQAAAATTTATARAAAEQRRRSSLACVNETRARLKLLGAPHMRATVTIECVYLTFLMLFLGAYLLGMLYFRHANKCDFHLLRAILDRGRERRHCDRMVARTVRAFIESSRNFTCARLGQFYGLELGLALARDAAPSAATATTTATATTATTATIADPWGARAAQAVARRLVLEHKVLVRELRLLAAQGQLRPLNRSRAWLDQMALLFLLLNSASLAWGLLFNVALYRILPKVANFVIVRDSLADWLLELELALMSSISTVAICFYLTTAAVSCLDQALLIARVHELIGRCRWDNARIYARSLRPLARPVAETASPVQSNAVDCTCSSPVCPQALGRARMNANLITAFMHYKIFVAQLRPVLRPVGFITLTTIIIMLAHSLLIRLHTPYVANQRLKSIYYFISLMTLFFVNLNIIPISAVNSRCGALYRALNSLLAHSVEVDQLEASREPQPDQRERIYDSHTIWMLRRELKWSQRFVKQFEFCSLGLTFTYANALKVYVYLGAILLSILSDSRSVDPLAGTRSGLRGLLEDPFGVRRR